MTRPRTLPFKGTLKEAKAEILLVQTEAAKVTEEVQRRIEDLTARWEKERAHRTEAEQRLADAVAKTAAITDAHDILQVACGHKTLSYTNDTPIHTLTNSSFHTLLNACRKREILCRPR